MAKIGPRWALVLGTLGYAPYAAGLYANSKFGNQWGIILGAVLCGLSAGIFWSTEGAIAIGYSEPERRGRNISIWLSLSQLGIVIGGAINLATNVNTDVAGGVGINTYAVFVALQCLGPLVALLLSPPGKVQRRDHQPVRIASSLSVVQEVKATLKVWARPHTLVLSIVFVQCQWGAAVTSTFVADFFTVRARALNSLAVALMCWLIFYPFGRYLDAGRYSIRFRAVSSAVFIFTWLAAGWIWYFVNLVRFAGQDPAPVYDWTTPGWANAWFSYVMYSLPQQLLYNWLFWIVSYLSSPDEPEDHVRYVGILRSAECVASTLSFAVSATSVPIVRAAAINLALFAVSVPAVAHTLLYIAKRDKAGLLVQTKHGEQASSKQASLKTCGAESPDSASLKEEKAE